MIRFDEKVAIVTGAGKGLGRSYAIYLAARGARVVVNNRRRSNSEPSSADEVVQAIRQAGGQAIANYDSVEDPAAGARIVQQAVDAWGRVDILINNAGVDQRSTFHKVSVEQFRQIFDINFYGSLYVTHAAYARMRAAGYGRIVVSTSVAGLYGLHGLTAYSASKAALIGFMRTLAMEGKSHNVLTNAIAPYAATPMTARQGNMPEEFMTTMRPEFVAPAVALLVSDQTSLNGQVIIAGKGAFRRAANVEGRGLRYAEPTEATAEALARDVAQLLDMEGATEFADAMAAFQQLFGEDSGAK
ncbi:MAG TPA: SDR family NAD(P)-dependent oxidoreductase [Steroidobacteraceae bacterium]|jgi:NAD(P)-dependent dehydrogenase (short-subunit alcohol dehydrogenase family)|nr:SDR family NAD(P)-dependent oxidoreductase [Steroidobacteraceae bacterium]